MKADYLLGDFLKKAELIFREKSHGNGRLYLLVTTDHGMTQVHSRFDLVCKVEALALKQPSDYLSVYDSTMARFWFFNENARQVITSALRRIPQGRILSEAELRDHLGRVLPGFKVPKYIVISEEPLPRNASEKIHRLALRNAFVAS